MDPCHDFLVGTFLQHADLKVLVHFRRMGQIMATRQRGSSNRASSSKQQPGLISMPTSGLMPRSPSPAASAPPAPHAASTCEQRIAISAYLRAVKRGFAPGHELEDWLAAERELAASESGLPSQRQ